MHAAGTYRLFNPATRKIILSRDVTFIRSERERSAEARAQIVETRRASPRPAVQQLDVIAEEVQGGDGADQDNEGGSNAEDGDGDNDNDGNSVSSLPDLVHEVDNSSDEEGDDDSMATPYLSSDTESIEESEEEFSDNDMPALIPPDDQSSSSDDDSMYKSRRATRTKLSRSKSQKGVSKISSSISERLNLASVQACVFHTPQG